jgi:hypothetical protein
VPQFPQPSLTPRLGIPHFLLHSPIALTELQRSIQQDLDQLVIVL